MVFELSPSGSGGWTETLLYNFQGGSGGAYPAGGLIFNHAGNLYGTTVQGGGTGCSCGTAFELSPNGSGGWTETILYSFQGGSDGAGPQAGLIFDKDGNLYGTSLEGGGTPCFNGAGCGTTFELSPNSGGAWTESVLYRFQGGSDGETPLSGLILDESGNLYGTTSQGGGTGCGILGTCGVAFEVSKEPFVAFSPTSLNFGNQTLDISSSPQVVTLTNSGNLLLTITSIQLTGANSSEFGQTHNCPASLAPYSSCSINVTFTPTTTGTVNAAVSVTDNAPGSSQSIPLTGVGMRTATTTTLSSISPSTVVFGTSVTLTANVNSAAGPPHDGEIVTFEDATSHATLGTGPLSKGTAVFTSTTIPGGSYSVVASYGGDESFMASASTPPQPLDVQDFKLVANPSTITISAPGQSGSTAINITTYGNLSALTLDNWSCSGLPSGSSCTFGTVGANDEISLNITTTVASDFRPPLFGRHQRVFYACMLPGFLGVVSLTGSRRRVRGLRVLAVLVVLGLPALWLACGGNSTPSGPGTPTGNSSVTVSANGAMQKRSTNINLIVQ